MPVSEPNYGKQAGVKEPLNAYSDAPNNEQNRVAQAGHAAAHHAEPGQAKASSKSRRIDEANLAKLVAEENASKGKFSKYPGLERWQLIEKMGDGAFSNVYRAKDLEGEHGEVAIKVVRKYEMNSMQVSLFKGLVFPLSKRDPFSLIIALCHLSHFCQPWRGKSPKIGKQTFTSRLQESP